MKRWRVAIENFEESSDRYLSRQKVLPSLFPASFLIHNLLGLENLIKKFKVSRAIRLNLAWQSLFE